MFSSNYNSLGPSSNVKIEHVIDEIKCRELEGIMISSSGARYVTSNKITI